MVYDRGQVAPALQVFLDLRCTRQWKQLLRARKPPTPHPAPSQGVQIMNELVNDPEKQTAILGARLAAALPTGSKCITLFARLP